MGEKVGQLISKLGGNHWDIGIKGKQGKMARGISHQREM